MLTYRWTQGNTHTQLAVSLVDPFGNPVTLTGLIPTNITLKMRPVIGNVRKPFVQLAGTVSITDAANGKFTYKFAASDVATSGMYEMGGAFNYGAGDVLIPFLISFEIVEA